MTLYSESNPKRPDITGSFDQAYSLTTMFEAVVKAITANLIAGIMGCQHSGEIFHLFCPKVHYDTAGNPVAVIGNLSNNIGQFMCARITKAEFSLFTVVGEKSGAPPTHGDTIDPAIMAKTTLDANIDYVAYLMPNYVLIYWAMEVFYGNIVDDDVKSSISSLGPGYLAWAKAVGASFELEEDIDTTLAEIKTKGRGPTNMLSTFGMKWDKKTGMAIAVGTAGVHVSMVRSSLYPAESSAIQQIFTPSAVASAAFPGALVSPTGRITFSLADDKESDAAKGATKFKNLFLKGVVDFENCSVSAIQEVVISAGYQVVLDTPRAGRATALQDLSKEVMAKTKTNDPLSIKTREMTLSTMSKATAANLIAGNFAVDHAGSQSNESTSVNLSIFLPQTELTLVRDTDAIDLQARTENNMDMADSHKSKQSTDIRRIGTLKTSADVRSVLVNMLVLFTAVTDGSLPLPILQQIVLNFLAFVTTSEWGEWVQSCGNQMPNLHLEMYGSIEKILIYLFNAATLFTNVNIVTGNRPLTDLDITPIIKALQLLKNIKELYTRHIISSTPLLVCSSIAVGYGILTTAPQAGSRTIQPAAANHNQQSDTATRSRAADRATDGGGDDTSNRRTPSPTKKGRGKADAVKDRTKFGIFYLQDPDAKGPVFPPAMDQKLCAYFTCKGRQCSSDNCSFFHPKNNDEITTKTLEQVCDHFEKTKIGWVNEWPVLQGKFKNFPEKFNHLLGGGSGPTKSSKSL